MTIDSSPPATTSEPSATFTFGATDNHTPTSSLQFECRFDGADCVGGLRRARRPTPA